MVSLLEYLSGQVVDRAEASVQAVNSFWCPSGSGIQGLIRYQVTALLIQLYDNNVKDLLRPLLLKAAEMLANPDVGFFHRHVLVLPMTIS